eukprot:GAHX01007314.1.p1 GENE.GAHX01007314.1~~GAHX01007314.1.p1  ORF type:complete len:79 (-),score=0.33 GAHX01007314.1:28-264(-)
MMHTEVVKFWLKGTLVFPFNIYSCYIVKCFSRCEETVFVIMFVGFFTTLLLITKLQVSIEMQFCETWRKTGLDADSIA